MSKNGFDASEESGELWWGIFDWTQWRQQAAVWQSTLQYSAVQAVGYWGQHSSRLSKATSWEKALGGAAPKCRLPWQDFAFLFLLPACVGTFWLNWDQVNNFLYCGKKEKKKRRKECQLFIHRAIWPRLPIILLGINLDHKPGGTSRFTTYD